MLNFNEFKGFQHVSLNVLAGSLFSASLDNLLTEVSFEFTCSIQKSSGDLGGE